MPRVNVRRDVGEMRRCRTGQELYRDYLKAVETLARSLAWNVYQNHKVSCHECRSGDPDTKPLPNVKQQPKEKPADG